MRDGFTLLEVLLAIALLVTGSVTLLEAINIGLFSGGINETELVAVNLAEEKMEFIRNTAYSSDVSEAKAEVSGFPGLEREVKVAFPDSYLLKEVTVNVYYKAKASEAVVSLVTYVTDYKKKSWIIIH